jgi:zinc transport system substrate-binding protein
MRTIPALLAAAAAALTVAACATAANTTNVVAAFYPLAWAAQSIGGNAVHVENLTPAGSEPHDIELTPRQAGEIQQANVVLYLSHGFQPAVEQALGNAKGTKLDILSGLSLKDGVGDEAGHADPHVWLDPVLFSRVVQRIGDALGRPAAGKTLAARVRALDQQFRRGLAHCVRKDFVTSHAAFGYLAQRYGLRQIAIAGLDPAAEPSPRKLAELVRLVEREHVNTIFFERLVSPKLAETVAREAHVKTAVLDPIEGLTPAEAANGATYLTVMHQNLAHLRTALGCR